MFLARAEAGAPVPDTESFDLGAWCRGWAQNWRDHPRAADIEVRAGGRAAWVHTQPAMLGQVLDNLLDNACKYSEPGTPVVVSVEAEPGAGVLTVADRGCGIPPEEATLVFQPFFRGQQARWLGKPGVGLGLAVVQRIGVILGGVLSVQSEPGRGSRFTVNLPLERAEGTVPGPKGPREDAGAGEARRPGERAGQDGEAA